MGVAPEAPGRLGGVVAGEDISQQF